MDPEDIMKSKNKLLSLLLIAVALSSGVSTYADDRDEYAASVMEIFHTHVQLLQELAVADRFKYSDNLVRHAVAIERTFGLLGPMEWHAAQAARIHSQEQGTNVDLNEDMFEDLARASRKSIKQLGRAAHDSMENYDREGILTAIDEMKQSCENCHSLLPISVAPDLWGPLKRK
jgi:hypothetical protein